MAEETAVAVVVSSVLKDVHWPNCTLRKCGGCRPWLGWRGKSSVVELDVLDSVGEAERNVVED